MEKILQGIRHFQQHVFPENRSLFQRLASGQSPEVLVVGCSDSRLALDLITQASPGDMFVCRNAGNIVPAHDHTDAVSATIEYAVCVLNVQHIIVCGHSDCGAMKGLLHPEKLADLPHVRRWLRHAEGARHALDELHPNATESEALVAVTKFNVRLQLEHLGTHPQIFARLRKGNLKLHGWVYQIESGEIDMWDAQEDGWKSLTEASHWTPTVKPAAGAEVQHA